MEQQLTFEAAFLALRAAVDELEAGELSLQESLAAYEKGCQMIAACREKLDEVKLRVAELSGEQIDDVP